MCIGFWSLNHPDYALILCTNRDEFLSRPTANAHFHCFGMTDPEANGDFVLSGRDLQAGGSWLGVNRAGRVALLTNISEPEGALYKASRGHLVSSFLLPDAPDADHFVNLLENEGSTDYAGFNLLLLKPKRGEQGHGTLAYEASLITNSGGHGAIAKRDLSPDEYRAGGVSNGVDNVDGRGWPKVIKGVASLSELLFERQRNASAEEGEDGLVEDLFKILSWQSEPPPTNRFQLRNSIEIPPLHLTGSLSPDALPDGTHDEFYGTRVSTVLLVKRDGQALFVERDFWKLDSDGGGNVIRGDPRSARVFRFKIDDNLVQD